MTVLDGVTGSGKTETYFAAIAAALAAGTAGAWCCCPRSRSARSGSSASASASASLPAQWHSDIGAGRAPRHLAGRRRRPGAGRRRRPLGAVPAVPRARPDRRRRGARPLLQAGGRGLLPGARHGGAARLARRRSRSCWSRRPRRSKPSSMSRAAATSGSPCRAATRRPSCPRCASSICGASGSSAAGFWRRRSSRELAATFAAGEQALLFLNRRGYAPLTLCRACGHRFQCPSCTAWLVEHRFTGRLLCHHCGHAEPVPACCPECLAAGALVPCGPGVERLLEEVGERFPAGARGADGQRPVAGPARRGRARRRR